MSELNKTKEDLKKEILVLENSKDGCNKEYILIINRIIRKLQQLEEAEQIFLKMIDEFDFNFYVEDEQVAELKYLLKSKINNGK